MSGVKQASVMIVRHGSHALILRRSTTAPWKPGHWNLPDGLLAPDETLKEAAVRECFEEADVLPRDVQFVGTFVGDNGYTVYCHVGETDSPHVALKLTDGILECDEWAWITRDQLSLYPFAAPSIQEMLLTVFDKGRELSAEFGLS